MPAKKKSSTTTTDKVVSKSKDVKSSAPTSSPPPAQPSPRVYVRPVALKYLTAQEYLLRKGVKPTHIPVYVAKAKTLGYTRATASDWEKLLFSRS